MAPSARAGGELDKDEFTETMEVMYGALGAEDVDLALAAACAERLLELVGEDEEMDEDDGLEGTSLTRLELAGACHDKVTATVRQAFADLAAVGAPELGPLPRYRSTALYDFHLAHAPIAHLSAFRHPWRLHDIMNAVS